MKKSKENILKRAKEKKENVKSKSQNKKLQKIEEKKKKLKNRKEVLEKLQTYSVGSDVLMNLNATSKIGQVYLLYCFSFV
jgi:Tfp pilus assembly protein PilN